MELKQLEFFVVCAQTMSFSKAGEQLFTAQSNVSKVIRALENELGTELFERKQHGISLTVRGRQIYEYACNTLESAKKISDYSFHDYEGELRIACNPSSWMAACFCEYYQEHAAEEVSYSIMTASTNDIIRRLASEVDSLGFVYILESQISLLQEKFKRNHLMFTPLKKTKAMLYFGQDREAPLEGEKIPLVQGYDDEFTLKSFLTEKQKGKTGKSPYKVKVTTNSDTIMNELLTNTELGTISGGYLSRKEEEWKQNAVPLLGNDNPVAFGCLFRNDRNLDFEQLKYLNYVRRRLEET